MCFRSLMSSFYCECPVSLHVWTHPRSPVQTIIRLNTRLKSHWWLDRVHHNQPCFPQTGTAFTELWSSFRGFTWSSSSLKDLTPVRKSSAGVYVLFTVACETTRSHRQHKPILIHNCCLSAECIIWIKKIKQIKWCKYKKLRYIFMLVFLFIIHRALT